MIEAQNWKWIAGRTLALTVGLAFVLLGAAGVGAAQSSQAAPTAAKAAPAAQKPSSANPTAKGLNTGIKVHGHWVIEVKNPDGRVTARREFENALSPGFTVEVIAVGGTAAVPVASGESLLSALMVGQATTVNGWAILLEGPNGINDSTGAPCAGTAIFAGACVVVQSSFVGVDGSPCTSPLAPFSCDLSVAPLGTAPNFSGFQLSGSAVAMQSGTVSTVVTADLEACGATSNSQTNCSFTNNNDNFDFAALTARNLDGQNGDPAAVTVSAGQTISATVTISFQ